MEFKKISNGEFKYRSYGDVIECLSNIKKDCERNIENLNKEDKNFASNFNYYNKVINHCNIIMSNSELAEKLDAMLVSRNIDAFVSGLSSRLSNGIILRNLSMLDVIGTNHEIKKHIELQGYDFNDFCKLCMEKNSFQLLECLYNMCGYEFPNQKINDNLYHLIPSVYIDKFFEYSQEYFDKMVPKKYETNNKSL